MGIIVSDKIANTRVVAVNARTTHKNYKKVITRTKRYVAHDAYFNTRIGDKVKIQETRPISKTKRWLVTDILEKVSI
nr:ribosomal protein S17 [Ochrosphaera neapolitana]